MQAIILAGGKGQRLRPLTDRIPKPMVTISGRPILQFQLEWLRREGITDIAISCGYRYEVIQRHFGDGSGWGVNIRYAIEETPLGRGGGIRRALALLDAGQRAEEIVVANGDIITDLPLVSVVAQHRTNDALATLMLTPFHSPYGIVDIDEQDRILGFSEKPELPYWINGGIYVLSPVVGRYLPVVGDIEDRTFPELARIGKLTAYRYRGYWRAIDTIKDLTMICAEITDAEGRGPFSDRECLGGIFDAPGEITPFVPRSEELGAAEAGAQSYDTPAS